MKKTYLFVIALLAVFGVATFAMGYYGEAPKVVVEGNYIEAPGDTELGAVSGPDVYGDFRVHGPFLQGGSYVNASTTLTVNDTLTADEVCKASVISVNSAATTNTYAAAGLTVTLPATSTLFTTCLTEVGDTVDFLFANLSPTAASTTVITAGAGMDLLECDDSSDCNVVIGGGGYAKVEIVRMPTAFETGLDAAVMVTEYTAAD